jgi:DNA topoisomerase IB
VDESTGERVRDEETLERIRSLAVPPAWSDVWICAHPNGHLQAVGTDAAGRRQYLYHERWRARRDQEKFDAMVRFARSLPALRARAAEHLEQEGLTRERVLAAAARLLDRGFFRVGGERYAEENHTYGLATIKRRHVRLLPGNEIVFAYPAKGGRRRVQSLVDPAVYEVVAALSRRRSRSDELLAYREGRRWRDVRSEDINDYVKSVTGGDCSAKDFRTWSATVLAALSLAVSVRAGATPAGRKRAIARAVREVARYLGNTPAVCRSAYIDPRVFDRYNAGVTIAGALHLLGDVEPGEPSVQGPIEEAVLDLLEDDRGSPALEEADRAA